MRATSVQGNKPQQQMSKPPSLTVIQAVTVTATNQLSNDIGRVKDITNWK